MRVLIEMPIGRSQASAKVNKHPIVRLHKEGTIAWMAGQISFTGPWAQNFSRKYLLAL